MVEVNAVKWGRLTRNPVASADPPRQSRSRAAAWLQSEVRRFLDQVHEDRLYALWRLAATSGMRRGELLGLTWKNIDLERGSLRVEQQLKPTKGGCSFGPPKSRRSERTIALDPATVEALKHYRDNVQRYERELAGPAYEDHDLVFCSEIGRPISPDVVSAQFKRHRDAAGIPTGTLHILRHTAATIALTEGVPLHVVAARLGDDPKTILATYSHQLPTSDEQAAAVMAKAIAFR